MKILFVGFRDINHSSAGGYDPIAQMPGSDYLEGSFIWKGTPKTLRQRLLKRLGNSWLLLLARLKRHRYDVMHCFYGDFCIFPFHRSQKHKVVITTHLDIKQRVRVPSQFLKLLRKANGVVVLGSQQAKQFREEYGINATFIPHGFNTPKFEVQMPPQAADFDDKKVNVWVSGQMYRDAKTIIHAVKYCEDRFDHIHFHLLGVSDEVKQGLRDARNATIYPRVKDCEYFTLLSRCDYNFLPVSFATANNTLLEGQSLGIRGIYPAIAGIEDYAAPSPISLYYHDMAELEQIFGNLQKSSPSDELKVFAERFNWKNIYPMLEKYYNSL